MMTVVMAMLFVNADVDGERKLAGLKSLLPAEDAQVLEQVAQSYELTGEAKRMLFIIRIVENGGPGREMGVLHPRAQRFKGRHVQSLKLQAQWAAGTLHKHWNGSVASFAERYCPAATDPQGHKNWIRNAQALLNRVIR